MEINYFKIKVDNVDSLKKAKKLVFVAFAGNEGSIYKSMSFDDADVVEKYLAGLGCNPIVVKKMNKLSSLEKS